MAGREKEATWIFALGQAFFSLSVAGNGTLIYGSYLPDSEDIPASAARVALFDTLAAMLAALVIIPAMQDTIQLPSNYNICSTIDTSIKLSTFLFKKNLYIIVGNTGRQCLDDRINIIRRLLFSNPLNCTGKHITI